MKKMKKNEGRGSSLGEDAGVLLALTLTVDGGEVLGVVVPPILCARCPIKAELSLSFPAAEPVKAELH